MMPPAVRRRILQELFGGDVSISLGSANRDLTPHATASFTTDDDRAVLASPASISGVPTGSPMTHVHIWRGQDLQWTAELPTPLVFNNSPNRAEWQPGEIVLNI